MANKKPLALYDGAIQELQTTDIIDNVDYASIKTINALQSNIKGTTQAITFNGDGTVQKVQHKDTGNNLIREDVFTYATNLITEVRTLTSGGTVTLISHLDTLETEVI